MPIPILYTERLLLKPLSSEDASQIQILYPRWEIVRYMVSSVPWPYPDNGAENYVNNVALPDIANGIAWIWTIRHRETPDNMVGLICLYDVEDNNRGFWLAPEHQGKGFMREACNAATDYWFNSLNKTILRAPKAALNNRSKRISQSSGMRLIRTEKHMSAVCWIPSYGKSHVMNGMLVKVADKLMACPLSAPSGPSASLTRPLRAKSGS